MRTYSCLIAMAALSCTTLHTPLTAAEIPKVEVQFKHGERSTVVEGTLKGHGTIDYTLRARAGQMLRVNIQPAEGPVFYDILVPGQQEPLFVGQMATSALYRGELPVTGEYALRLYLMGAAKDEGQSVDYKLSIGIDEKPEQAEPAAHFKKELSLQGVTFLVETKKGESGETLLVVTPKGLEEEAESGQVVIEGGVIGAEVGDLNVSGSPEIYIYTRGSDDAKRGKVFAWATNSKKSMTRIYMAEPAADDPNFAGYHGHDEFTLVENVLARKFPVGGKMRYLQYKLVAGEASWQLKVVKTEERDQ